MAQMAFMGFMGLFLLSLTVTGTVWTFLFGVIAIIVVGKLIWFFLSSLASASFSSSSEWSGGSTADREETKRVRGKKKKRDKPQKINKFKTRTKNEE
jgi:hypothetical protein